MTNPHTAWELHIGPTVRALRSKAKVAQNALAEAAGLHPAVLVRIERGGHTPSLSTLERVAIALGLSTSALIQRVEKAAKAAKAAPRKKAKS
jgi:transcriptional regulator with XRE-family HTH domain